MGERMRRKRVEELEGGESLAKPILLDIGTVLIYEDTILKKEYIDKLLELGIEEVYIREEKKNDEAEQATIEEKVRNEYSSKVKELLEHHVHNNNSNIGELREVAQNIFDQVIEQKEVLDCVIEIHERSADIYEHSVSTCVLSVLTALKLGTASEKAKEIAVGSLLHDIGMRYIETDVVNKNLSDLNAYDAAEYKKHPVYGYSAVEKAEWISQTAKSIILSHHECIDGSGFPLHTRNNDITRQIVAVCDTFDSMICGIGNRRRKVHEAIEYVRYNSGIKFNKKVCEIFLEFIFLYPNGTRILLNNGKEAIVIRQNRYMKERPVIRMAETREIIDMMKENTIFIEKIL